MPGLLPPSSINDLRTKAMVAVYERLGKIDLTKILVYVIDNVPASALPFLAWQFDVQSPWFATISGETSQRDLIKTAVPLHAMMGTPASVKQIIAALGFAGATILEGQTSWGGTKWPSTQGWAVFRVVIPLPSTPVTTAQQLQLVQAIDFFKPQSRWLDEVLWLLPPIVEPAMAMIDSYSLSGGNNIVEPKLKMIDLLSVEVQVTTDLWARVALHDGHYRFAGGFNYGATRPSIVDDGITLNGVPVT